jgi:transcriptional regulator with XRE-family HTH domain
MTIMLLGQLLRQRRQADGLLLGDLARSLNISVPYLSQIETGRRFVPDDFASKVIKALKLNATDANEMRRAAGGSRSEYRIVMGRDTTVEDRTLARDLAESFARLSADAKAEMREVLRKNGRG